MSSEIPGDDFAIRLRGVSKHYLMYERPEDRLKQMVLPRLARAVGQQPKRYFRDFSAVENVSLDIGHGETVGIIGRNGSGKSTLLQMICGTLQPSSGSIEVRGRIAALLELGAGFNPEFTGRENVYLNGAILGLSREEVDERYDRIAGFADIGHFIDQPVRTYSSGMYVRLAFAVAISVDPAILIVDEALSVGDEAFQRKCFARIEAIRDQGATILFVSHGAQTIVQLCDRAVLLDGGEKLLEGEPKLVVGQYQRLINLSGDQAAALRADIRKLGAGIVEKTETRILEPGAGQLSEVAIEAPVKRVDDSWFDKGLVSQSAFEYEHSGATLRNVRIENAAGEAVNVLRMGFGYAVRYEIDFDRHASDIRFGFQVKTMSGVTLAGGNNAEVRRDQIKVVVPGDTCSVRFGFQCRLLPGTYALDVGVMGTHEAADNYLHRIVDVMIIRVSPEADRHEYGFFSLEIELGVDVGEGLGSR